MRHVSTFTLALVAVVGYALPAPGFGGPASERFAALRSPALAAESIAVAGLRLERDVFELVFEEGRFFPLESVDGVAPGAVFVGRGELTLRPASDGERRHLALRRGQPELEVLRARFDSAVLFAHSDGSAEAIRAAGPASPLEGAAAQAARAALARALDTPLLAPIEHLAHARLNRQGFASLFYGVLDLDGIGLAAAVVDPRGVLDHEEVALLVPGDEYPYWYSSHTRAEASSGDEAPCRPKPLADAEHYQIDARIARDTTLEASAELRLRVLADELAVLPLGLHPALRVRSVELLGGAGSVVAHQESQRDAERRGDDRVSFLFDPPLARGAVATIRIGYGGDGVVDDGGGKTYRVGARTSWYPNLGVGDRATYDLVFRVPPGNTVVAVGAPVDTSSVGNETVSRWRAEQPISVAGFNYGAFAATKRIENNTGITIEVYATKGTPDLIREINSALSANDQVEEVVIDGVPVVVGGSGASSVGASVEQLTQNALADGINTVQVLTATFGRLPQGRIAITQQEQWVFGQSWPTLIYLPYIAGFSSTVRRELGMSPGVADFVDEVGIHEVAHQWWGHLLGWESYRDQWLSEGFAEFSTALVLEATRGPQAYQNFWERRRRDLFDSSSSLAAADAGAITLGFRAAQPRAPAAYGALSYGKGGYVLHMLRMAMRDRQATENADRRFFEMMRDFVATHAGQNPSTGDFERALERHITPELDVWGDGRADWFVDQWVHGAHVPRYAVDFTIAKATGNSYRLAGTLAQQGVPDDFLALVPLYVDLGRGQFAQFGRAPMKGASSRTIELTLELPRKPRGVVANAQHDLLYRD